MELIIAGLIIWGVIHFIRKAQKKQQERQEAAQRQLEWERRQGEETERREQEERERPAREEKARLEAQQRRERDAAKRAAAQQAAAEEHARRVATFASYPVERLRFEHQKCQSKISDLKAELRQEKIEGQRAMDSVSVGTFWQAALDYTSRKQNRIEGLIAEIEAEMALINEAINGKWK